MNHTLLKLRRSDKQRRNYEAVPRFNTMNQAYQSPMGEARKDSAAEQRNVLTQCTMNYQSSVGAIQNKFCKKHIVNYLSKKTWPTPILNYTTILLLQ